MCVGPKADLDGCGKSRSHRDYIPGPYSPYRVAVLNNPYRTKAYNTPERESYFIIKLFSGEVKF